MLQKGISEAKEIMAGKRTPARVRKYRGRILTEIVEEGRTVWNLAGSHDVTVHSNASPGERVQAIRAALKQSQAGFAELLGISVGTLQGWEQDRREPRGPSKTLLEISFRAPELLFETSEDDKVFA